MASSHAHSVRNPPRLGWSDVACQQIARAYFGAGPFFLICAGFLIPIRLSWTYGAILPLTSLWLLLWIGGHTSIRSAKGDPNIVLLFFFTLAAASAIFTLNPSYSLLKLAGHGSFVFALFAIRDVCSGPTTLRFFLALMLGQACAALHTLLERLLPGHLPAAWIGAVSESGQLAMILPLACGVILALTSDQAARTYSFKIPYRLVVWALCNTALLSVVALKGADLRVHGVLTATALMAALSLGASALTALLLPRSSKFAASPWLPLLILLVVPLLGSALLINLKRGPWAGVLVALTILSFRYARKLFVPLILAAAALFMVLEPVQQRLLQSPAHFFISGGRSEMWQIGMELALRYPLGIGFRNSGFLQHFSLEIPPDLTHFHNNLINVLAETGWLGLGLYLWWIIALLRIGFSETTPSRETILSFALSCALLSWQIAGLVEYNFGDSEVSKIALFLAGTVAALHNPRSREHEVVPHGEGESPLQQELIFRA